MEVTALPHTYSLNVLTVLFMLGNLGRDIDKVAPIKLAFDALPWAHRLMHSL